MSTGIKSNQINEIAKASPDRIDYLDVAKGIGIILVVWAHARGPYSRFIYQMHMPFFFLISGMLYSSRGSLKDYIVKKIKRLYIPFAFWNILFYTIKSVIHGVSKKAILNTDIKIALTLSKDGQFFGATWFLASLFVVRIVYKIVDCIVPENRHKDYFVLVLFLIHAIIGFEITLKYMLSRTLICGSFFAMGAFMKKHKSDYSGLDCLGVALLGALTFLLIGNYGSANMGANKYSSPILFMIGASLSSYALLYFCRLLVKGNNIIKKSLIFLGKNSMDVVIWQFIAFRIVIVWQMYLNNETISVSSVLSYYPCYSTNDGWWFVYFLVGLFVPVIFCSVCRFGIWGRLFKKLHIF